MPRCKPIFLRPMAALALLGACGNSAPPYSVTPNFAAPQIEHDSAGRCYGRDVTPAVIETVTDQVMVQPATIDSSGKVLAPAAFRTVTRQVIVRERREVLFETICPPNLTEDFVKSLQRALKARGYYDGEISGIMDAGTQVGIQRFQRQTSHDSSLLNIETARALGLVELTQEQLGVAG